jgi:hypothetical protein
MARGFDFGSFAGNFMQAFQQSQHLKQQQQLQKDELKHKTKLYELQLKREQMGLDKEQDAATARDQLLAQMTPQQVPNPVPPLIRAPGQPEMVPGGRGMGLIDLLADPQNEALALRSGLIAPKDLLGGGEPTDIRELRILAANPELAAMDERRRRAAAASTSINLDSQGLTKPPAGFFRPDPKSPGLKPEPGGPAEQEAADKQRQQLEQARLVTDKTAAVQTEITRALDLVGPLTTGFAGKQFSGIEGSDSYDLSKALETVKANLGFDELQKMRAASPTGGALGSVAVKELEGLQSTVASLDQFQSDKVLRKNLEKIQGHYKRWADAVSKAENTLPDGIPAGSTQIGTSNGKPVYQSPDGKRYIVE